MGFNRRLGVKTISIVMRQWAPAPAEVSFWPLPQQRSADRQDRNEAQSANHGYLVARARAKSKVKADRNEARFGYTRWIGPSLGLPSDLEEIMKRR